MSIWNNSKWKPYMSATLNKALLMEKSPAELEKIGRKQTPPVELDKRMKKETLVDLLYDAL
tara:strand:+ start:750 stop:932 length:183 start_codon:yes stop_codon:yes gene_type:complete